MTISRHALLGTALALSAVAAMPAARAGTAEDRGLAIAEEMARRDAGWGDSTVAVTMILGNREGETSTRALRIRSLEVVDADRGDKSLIVFDRPRDVGGTALLSHTHIHDADDQWLYLPALKRVKRVSSKNKSGPFVGSEFAFEDLLAHEVVKYGYKWLRDESCGEGARLRCFVVERYPKYEESGYTRHVVWIDVEEYRPLRIDYFDRKGARLKTMTLTDYRAYAPENAKTYWRAHLWDMENHQTGKTTRLAFGAYDFRTGLNDRAFTSSRLTRVR